MSLYSSFFHLILSRISGRAPKLEVIPREAATVREKLQYLDDYVWLLLLIPLLLKFGLPSPTDLATSLVEFTTKLSF